MRSHWTRLGTATAILVMTAAVMAAPAGAASPEVFTGSASGTALALTIGATTTSVGDSSAQAASALTAKGQGIGSLSLLGDIADQTASVAGPNQTVAKPQVCANAPLPALPSPLPALTLNLACSTASATTANNLPTASATATVAGTSADLSTILSMVITPGSPTANALQSTLGQLGSVTAAIPLAGAPLSTVLSKVLNAALTTQTLGIKVGGTTSSVTTTGATVAAKAVASGAEIDLLAVAGGQPLVKIVVGSAGATATYDRSAGRSSPVVDPAIVTVTVAGTPPIALSTGQAPLTVLKGTPLESTITPAAGATAANPDGSVKATAAGVGLQLLRGLGGGINLQLAGATAAVSGSLAAAQAPAPQAPGRTLPRTGGVPWVPLVGVGLLGLAISTRGIQHALKASASTVRA